jgi:hypothetical protein
MRLSVVGCWLLVGSLLAGVSGRAQTTDATLLLPQMPLHDPFILAYAPTKTYYLYTSNVPSLTQVRRVGTMVYTSKDLKHWAAPKVVFTVPEGFWGGAGWMGSGGA